MTSTDLRRHVLQAPDRRLHLGRGAPPPPGRATSVRRLGPDPRRRIRVEVAQVKVAELDGIGVVGTARARGGFEDIGA